MSRVVIIGITQESLSLANTLALMDFQVTCFEQDEHSRKGLEAAAKAAQQNHVNLVYSTHVDKCKALGHEKGVELTTSSIIMTVPTVILACPIETLVLEGHFQDELYVLDSAKEFDLSPFTAQSKLTQDVVSHWMRLK